MASRGGGTSGGHRSGGRKMTVGDGVDPPGFSRDAYGGGMQSVNGTVLLYV